MKLHIALLSSIFFMFVLNPVSAQEYFSKRYALDTNAAWDFSTDIINIGSGYVLKLEGGTLTEVDHRRFGFIKLDSLGNIMPPVKIYSDSICDIGSEYGGSFNKLTGSNGYAMVGYKSEWVPSGRWDRGMLWRFNTNLDTLWTKVYSDTYPFDTSFMFVNFRELPGKGFITVGGNILVDGNGFLRIDLLKFDSIGITMWHKQYGSYNFDYYSYDVTYTSDNGFVIGGGVDPYNTTTQDVNPVIIKTDSIGNVQWTRYLGSPNCGEEFAMVDQAKDGNIQCGSEYSDSCSGWDHFYSRINLVKIQNNNEIVWDKKYGLSKVLNILEKIKVLDNGDIIATGHYDHYYIGGVNTISWIIKTDSAGNEEWYREYMLLYGNYSNNLLYNVNQTNDQGFIACGFVYPQAPDTGIQDSWVLKVDSLGCESPGNCWVGQNDIIVKTFTPAKPFVVFPNPATEHFSVEFHENPDGANIEVYDLFGRMQFKNHLHPLGDKIDIDASNWKKGVYMVKVLCGIRILGVEKLVME